MSTDPAKLQTAPQQENLPSVAPPVERKSKELSPWEYAKGIIMVALVTKLSALAGYAAGRFAPAEILPKSLRSMQKVALEGKTAYPLANVAAMVTGTAGGVYEAWKRWRKIKGKELGVRDIHTDVYRELDPALLQAEVEQNQRIQDGISTLAARNIVPRGSYAEEALKTGAAGSLHR